MRLLDTLEVPAPRPSSLKTAADYTLPVYRETPERKIDLLHTSLHLTFDWESESLQGLAILHLKPYFDTLGSLSLDARQLEVSRVRLLRGKDSIPLTFHSERDKLHIRLDRTYSRSEDFRLTIDYLARPGATGGSAAISSNQGLFFINAQGKDPEKPRQLWTQGETNWNSKWFPTIDHPNERATQEIFLTVDTSFVTLSNGRQISSVPNGAGLRTDRWVMELPHAPYLTMIAVGQYAIVSDSWKGIPLSYYVEPAYKEHARAIFPFTPEMLQFFSDLLGYPYPWPTYSQIVVRDFVSGAMENTTASVFGEFVQKTRRELIDIKENEKIVAHEMFHQWFGNLVTCESWANLALNEGFANYSEYLWLEHQYGRDEADLHLKNEWEGYFADVTNNLHPLIHFGYEENEDMFDAHSYNKGGSILHVLRNDLGDEAFFQGLNRYLQRNAFQAVESHHLRLAFEEVTGKDLSRFFEQWFFGTGHPILRVSHTYDEVSGVLTVDVEQEQHPDRMNPVFELPTQLGIRYKDSLHLEKIIIRERKQVFQFPVPVPPDWVSVDPFRILPASWEDEKSDQELAEQFLHAPSIIDRTEALDRLAVSAGGIPEKLFPLAFNHPFWAIRKQALEVLPEDKIDSLIPQMAVLARNDANSAVRAAALQALAIWEADSLVELAKGLIATDSSYLTIAAALDILSQREDPQTAQFASLLEGEGHAAILNAIGRIYASTVEPGKMAFFRQGLNKIQDFAIMDFYESFLLYGLKSGPAITSQVEADLYETILQFRTFRWKRLGAMATLGNLRDIYLQQASRPMAPEEKSVLQHKVNEVENRMKTAMDLEPDAELREIYKQFETFEKE